MEKLRTVFIVKIMLGQRKIRLPHFQFCHFGFFHEFQSIVHVIGQILFLVSLLSQMHIWLLAPHSKFVVMISGNFLHFVQRGYMIIRRSLGILIQGCFICIFVFDVGLIIAQLDSTRSMLQNIHLPILSELFLSRSMLSTVLISFGVTYQLLIR